MLTADPSDKGHFESNTIDSSGAVANALVARGAAFVQ